MPHFGQWTIGIGSPQYLWRLKAQSFILYWTPASPMPFSSRNFSMHSMESFLFVNPFRNPELTISPSPV